MILVLDLTALFDNVFSRVFLILGLKSVIVDIMVKNIFVFL
jgi:hypothetical protein